MSIDYYVDQYKEDFIKLYDRNSKEFRKDLDRLVSAAASAGANREKYRILDIVRTKRMQFTVDALDNSWQKVVSPMIAQTLERELGIKK